MTDFEPKILAFCCNWCSYAGADLAGVSRIQYPPAVRIMRVMCSGRVDPIFVVESLRKGADGVLVLGCHFGDCHYQSGNYQAERKVKLVKTILSLTSVEPERVRIEWVSSSEGGRFAEIISNFTEKISEIGRLEMDDRKIMELDAAKDAVKRSRLRIWVDSEIQITDKGNAYNELIDAERFDELLNSVVEDEYERSSILTVLNGEKRSVKEVSRLIDVPTERVLRHIWRMKKKGLVTLADVDETSPRYTAVEVSG